MRSLLRRFTHRERFRTIDRYVLRAVAHGWLVVLLVLLSVFTLWDLVEELERVGRGRYTVGGALGFVLLTVPRRVLDVAPLAALLGSILGLGRLADGHELVAMQVLGVSPHRIGWSVARGAVVLMVLLLAAEEFVASPLGQLAEAGRLQALSTTGVWRSEHGFWSRDGSRFLNVRRVLHGGLPADVDVYEFDAGGQLRVFMHAERADLRDPRRWQLTDVEERVLDGRVQAVRRVATLEWPSFLQPDQIGILILPPDSLAPSDLLRYVAYLRERGQNADRYELALWQKGIKPLISAALIVMAVPFVFGSLRTTTAGRRMLGATAVGISFYLANQMVGQLGLLWNLHPAVTTLAPLLLALAVAGWLWRRV